MTVIPMTLSVFGFAGALLAQSVSENEPNNTPGQATPIACGEHVEATIGVTGDVDWFVFTLASPARVLLQTGTDQNGAVLDNVMELRQSNVTLDRIAVNDDDTRSWLAAISEHLPAGTYYVQMREFGNGTGGYSFDLQCDPVGALTPHVSEAVEPNGPFGTGTPTTLAFGDIGEGDLAAADSDLWAFTLATASVVRIETGRGLAGATSNDTIMTLLDSLGAQLEFDDDDAPGLWSLIIATLPAGTYYADVQGFGGGNAGSYTILLQGFDATVMLPEMPEPNGDPLLGGVPSVLACGVLGGGEITNGDSDWWQFTLLDDSFVDLAVWGGEITTTTPIPDSLVRVFDSNSTQLAEDDDDFYDRAGRLSLWLEAGTYYAEVVGFGASAGSYTLALNCDEQALYHTFAGGCPGSGGLSPQWNVREWELPLTGSTLVGEFSNCPANGVIFPFVGFSRTISSGGIPLPVDLGLLGAPGCLVEVDPAGLLVLLTDAQGAATWAFSIPQNPTLAGVVFAQQAFVFDLTANGLGLTTSNAGHGIVSTLR